MFFVTNYSILFFIIIFFVGELVQRGDSKMPYSKIDQLGITFQDLPLNLQEEIGRYPKKPHLYGSAQRRKLWTTRHDWSFCVSLSTASDPASPSASHTTTTTHISARPPTSHPSTVPVTASPSTSHASTIPVSVRPSTFHTSTIPDSVQPSTSHSPTVPVTALPSTSHTSTISVSVHPSTFSTLAQQSLSTTSGFIVSQGEQQISTDMKSMNMNVFYHNCLIYSWPATLNVALQAGVG